MVRGDTLDYLAVLDWGSCGWGDPARDFAVTRAKVWMSEEGRKRAIGLFEARLEETWKQPVLDYSL